VERAGATSCQAPLIFTPDVSIGEQIEQLRAQIGPKTSAVQTGGRSPLQQPEMVDHEIRIGVSLIVAAAFLSRCHQHSKLTGKSHAWASGGGTRASGRDGSVPSAGRRRMRLCEMPRRA